MSLLEQQITSAKVLNLVKQFIDNEAIIAGGAPRNWKEGKLANDIDLYFRSFCNTSGKLHNQIAKALNISRSELDEGKVQDVSLHDYGGLNIPIKYIKSYNIDNVLFQFICIEPYVRDFKETVVNHMDIGLNRISYDGYSASFREGEIRTTKEYDIDSEGKLLTLYPGCMEGSQLAHCLNNHLPKMQSYYPDYKLVINRGE